MVAWELGAIEEKAAHNDEAVKWYTISAERFRRPDWKKKAEEALTRLGAPLPTRVTELKLTPEENTEAFHIPAQPAVAETVLQDSEEEEAPLEASAPDAAGSPAVTANGESDPAKKRRRRGRRGGRNRRRKGPASSSSLPPQAFAQSESVPPAGEARPIRASSVEPPAPRTSTAALEAVERPRPRLVEPPPESVFERTAHGRAGDPALASRMARLDSMLRRLISGAPHRLGESDEAPAGPGVFLLSDADLVTSYYIEACQTLRVGVGNLARGGRGGKNPRAGRGFTSEALKAQLAEHLGISESKVIQYMKDHCVVRWIQLDEEAPHLAHFAIGVLRTPLNVD